MNNQSQSTVHTDEESSWNTIADFEKILESTPDNITALETLSKAYSQIGDHARACDYSIRLAEIFILQQNIKDAASLANRLRHYAETNEKAAELLTKIESLAAGNDALQDASPSTEQADSQNSWDEFNIAREISFAWSLMKAGRISQDEYAEIVQDMTEMSGHHTAGTVSVLHVMEARGTRHLEEIIGYISEEWDVPVILLDNFDPDIDSTRLLPREFMTIRGAVVFDTIGQDALVAVLNPSDETLLNDVRKISGRQCHFYITLASHFDRFLGRFDQAVSKPDA